MRTTDAKYEFQMVEISCSEMMADYLDYVKDEKNVVECPFREVDDPNKFGVDYDNTIILKMREIASETLDVGDIFLCSEMGLYTSMNFERKDFDFCYEKTVDKVEDKLVYMTSNDGNQFAVKMNDLLYLTDRPKAGDKVMVTKFLSGKSVVTNITERYEPPSTLEELEQLRDYYDMNTYDDVREKKLKEIDARIEKIKEQMDEFDNLVEDY